jgi:hypothetical protein
MLPPEFFAALEREREKQSTQGFDIATEIEQRTELGLHEIYRNALKSICGTELYNKVREKFITQPQYWRTEEGVARTICDLLLDHHTLTNDERVSIFDLTRPSMCVLEQLWEDHRVDLERQHDDRSPVRAAHSTSMSPKRPRQITRVQKKRHRHARQRETEQMDKRQISRMPLGMRHRGTKQRDTRQSVRADLPPSSRTRSKCPAGA